MGKRKRDAVVLRRQTEEPKGVTDVSVAESDANTNDIFRKYFESRFTPLPQSTMAAVSLEGENDENKAESDSDDDDGDDGESDVASSEWSGISRDDVSVPAVEVVDHAGTFRAEANDPIEKIFQKSFMSSKPPREVVGVTQTTQDPTPKNEDDAEEHMNFKHDLDLQRLLRESHLLEQAKKQAGQSSQRHKVTDLRLQSLGSKSSLFDQEKMPMMHRKGILAKNISKDSHRRKEARENGIIIEKSSGKPRSSSSRRDRGVDVPVVGKFRDGTLQLSRKDLASIQGPRRAATKRGRR